MKVFNVKTREADDHIREDMFKFLEKKVDLTPMSNFAKDILKLTQNIDDQNKIKKPILDWNDQPLDPEQCNTPKSKNLH